MKMMPLAGLAVAVVKDGKVVHAKGYGITAVSSKQNVDENTLFAIASNSKAFTTAALAILVDEGKLRWHDKVVDYIPEFRMYNPYVTDNFNIQDLLTHRSGLGLGAGDLMFFPDGSNFTVHDVIRSFQYQVPVSAFRTKYDYDNLLYVVAGEVVSRVSGMSWSEFVQKRIMNPLGMTRSAGVFQNIKDRSNIASPHSVVDASLKELKPYTKSDESLGAAGGIYASVNDLSKWMLMHLNNGRYGEGLSHELISEASRKELWRPHTFINFTMTPDARNNTHFTAYGLGWRLHDQAGHIVVSHTGGLPGMLSKTTLIPDLKLGVVVLTNTDPGGRSFQTISMSIVDSYLGLDPFDYISDARQTLHVRENAAGAVVREVWRVIQQNKPPTIPLANLVGTYRDKWFGDVTIAMRDGALWFTSLRSPKLTGRMYYYQANTFAVKWEYQDMDCDAFATFTLDENGYGTAIGMKGISPNIDFSFDFHDLKLQKVKPEN
jgi:CubicO group peptidase (beta-lactamase class C family)